MVARGDLGVEMNPWDVPVLQKRIVETCKYQGKPVVRNNTTTVLLPLLLLLWLLQCSDNYNLYIIMYTHTINDFCIVDSTINLYCVGTTTVYI